jgi:hypothetical protein
MEEIHAKMGEIFDGIEATPNNLENIEISEGVNICIKIVASQCAELNTGTRIVWIVPLLSVGAKFVQ